jgi:hypothetical protein
LNTVQQFGGSLGVAVLGAVCFGGLAPGYPAAFTGGILTMIALLAAAASVTFGLGAGRGGEA